MMRNTMKSRKSYCLLTSIPLSNRVWIRDEKKKAMGFGKLNKRYTNTLEYFDLLQIDWVVLDCFSVGPGLKSQQPCL